MVSRLAFTSALAILVVSGPACTGSPDTNADAGAEGGSGDCAGKPDGAPCGNPSSSACDAPDTCLVGICMRNTAAAGTSCGDPVGNECDDLDRCDGLGACLPVQKPDGTACGDPTSTACDQADSCRSGVCESNVSPEGTACGGPSSNECTAAASCDGQGGCVAPVVADGSPCGDDTASACDLPDSCLDGVCTPNYVAAGSACGSPSEGQCDLPDSCDGAGACESNWGPDGLLCTDCPAGPGQCGTCSQGSCPDTTCLAATSSLTTTFAGGSNRHGNMFDVEATNSVVVSQITVHPNSTGNARVKVFTTPDGIAGKLTDPGEWTEEASVVVNMTAGVPVAIPVTLNILLPAGSTTGFYVTGTSSQLRNTFGSGVGEVAASDANLTIREGFAVGYPFDTPSPSRVFNGTLSYAMAGSLAMPGGGSTREQGQMFDVRALSTTRLTGLDLRLAFGAHDVSVYIRPGSHVGFENDPTGWFPIGSYSGLFAFGPGRTVEFSEPVVIPAGTTAALYVTSTTAGGALLTAPGTALGAVTASNGLLEVLDGAGVSHPFGGTTGLRAFDGRVNFSHCP